MHNSLKSSRLWAEAAKRANRILDMMQRTAVSREKDVIMRLYKTLPLVCQHIEYYIQACCPFLKDIDKEFNAELQK